MTRALENDGWLGYAALACAAIIVAASRFGMVSEPIRALVGISVIVFGVYCAVRGVFCGRLPSRLCAGLALLFWGYAASLLLAALSHARIR